MSRMDAMGMGNAGEYGPTGEGKRPMAEVNYRQAPTPDVACARCRHFSMVGDTGQGACELVAGTIDPAGTCDLYEPMEQSANVAPAPAGAVPGTPVGPGPGQQF
jgi:hypothetical protein